MSFTIDHVLVPVPHALFSVRLARVHTDGEVSVLSAQLRSLGSSRDVDALEGTYAANDVRHQLVLLDDINANTGRCKLGRCRGVVCNVGAVLCVTTCN